MSTEFGKTLKELEADRTCDEVILCEVLLHPSIACAMTLVVVLSYPSWKGRSPMDVCGAV